MNARKGIARRIGFKKKAKKWLPKLRLNALDGQSWNVCGQKNEASIAYEVCKNVSFVNTKNSVNVSVILGVPQDTVAGNKTATLTFTATQRSGAFA